MEILEIKNKIQDEVLKIWEKYTLQSGSTEVDFFDSGGDSLSAIKLIVEIQAQFDISISLESFMSNPTLNFLYHLTEKSYN